MMNISTRANSRDLPPGVEIKRATADISTVTPTGIFEGYASLFGVVDSGRDEIMPGAFTASLAKRSASGVKMLWQHRAAEPIGQWTAIAEDGRAGCMSQGGSISPSPERAKCSC